MGEYHGYILVSFPGSLWVSFSMFSVRNLEPGDEAYYIQYCRMVFDCVV